MAPAPTFPNLLSESRSETISEPLFEPLFEPLSESLSESFSEPFSGIRSGVPSELISIIFREFSQSLCRRVSWRPFSTPFVVLCAFFGGFLQCPFLRLLDAVLISVPLSVPFPVPFLEIFFSRCSCRYSYRCSCRYSWVLLLVLLPVLLSVLLSTLSREFLGTLTFLEGFLWGFLGILFCCFVQGYHRYSLFNAILSFWSSSFLCWFI